MEFSRSQPSTTQSSTTQSSTTIHQYIYSTDKLAVTNTIDEYNIKINESAAATAKHQYNNNLPLYQYIRLHIGHNIYQYNHHKLTNINESITANNNNRTAAGKRVDIFR